MALSDDITVTIRYLEQGKAQADKSLKSLQAQLKGLTQVNASLMMSTGKVFPQFAQQAMLINSLGGASNTAAKDLVKLRQEGSTFSKVFSQDTRQAFSELFNTGARFKVLGDDASGLRSRFNRELSLMKVATDSTGTSLRNLTDVERVRIMGNVWGQQAAYMSRHIISWGKNMQWVGRQLITGLTLPLAFAGQYMMRSFLTFNKSVTGLQRFLAQTGLQGEEFARVFTEELEPAFDRISVKTGLYRDQVIDIGSAWVAAGYDIDSGMMQLTDLTAQLSLATQGELSMEKSMELIRSVQATWGLTIEDTTEQLKQLVLVGNETSLTLLDIADALPVASSAAQNLNIEATELAALLAGMREQGVPATQAAQTLKFSFNRLIVPTQKTIDAWEGLGTGKTLDEILWEDGEGRGIEAMRDLFTELGELSQEAQSEMAGILFGGYRADRMLKLIKAFNTEGSQLGRALDTASDSARALALWQEQLDIVTESSAQKFQVMKVELITLAQKLGSVIFPYVEKFGGKLLDLLTKFEESPNYIKHFVVALGGILAAIGPVIYVTAQLTEAFGILRTVLYSGPLQALFRMRSHEDVFGFLKMARSSTNPQMKLLAGIPLLNTEISATSTAAAHSITGIVAALQAEGIAVDKLSADYLRLAALRRGDLATAGALSNIASTGLPDYRLGPGGQIRGPGVASRWNPSVARFQTPSGLFSGGIAGVRAGDLTEDALRSFAAHGDEFKKLGTSVTQGIAFGVSESAGLILPQTIASSTASAAVTAADSPAIDQGAKTFAQKASAKLGKWWKVFTTGGNAQLIGAATSGGTATLFNVAFGNPLKILLGVAAAAGVLSNIPELMEGWGDEFKQLSEILREFGKYAIEAFSEMFGWGKDVDTLGEAFVRIGDTIGNVVLNAFKNVLIPLGKVAITILGGIVRIGSGVVQAFANIAGAILTFNPVNIIKSVVDLFFSWNSSLSTIENLLVKIGALIATVFVASKVAGFFSVFATAFSTVLPNAISAFSAIGAAGVGALGQVKLFAGTAVGALSGFRAAVTALSPTMGLFLNPWILIPTLVIGASLAINTFFRKVDRAAEAAADHAMELKDAILGINEALEANEDISGPAQTLIDEVKSLAVDVTAAVPDFSIGGNDEFGAMADRAEYLRQKIAELDRQPRLEFVGKSGQLSEAAKEADKLRLELQAIEKTQEVMESTLSAYLTQLEGFNTQELTRFQKISEKELDSLRANKALTDATLERLPVGSQIRMDMEKQSGELEKQITFVSYLLQLTRGKEFLEDARFNSFQDELKKRLAQAGVEAGKAGKKAGNEFAKNFKDALENQLSQLTNRITDAVLDAFDDSADARLERFDEMAEGKTEAIDKEIEAIDKQIEKIDEQNEEEEWLQQQREYRRRRNELLQQQELAYATSYIERLKAIHEGRMDDARLIELQMFSDEKENQRQIRDLDREHQDALDERRDQRRIKRLEKEREALEKEKEILQERLDAQREALQEQLEAQRELLQNLFEELNEFSPKNEKEWKKHYQEIQQLAERFGVDVGRIQSSYAKSWGESIVSGLRDAKADARREAAEMGDAVGKGAAAAAANAKKDAYSPADVKLYKLMSNFLKASQSEMTPGQLAGWVSRISDALQDASQDARSFIQDYAPTTDPNATRNAVGRRRQHTGGYQYGTYGSEQPAMLQAGEYVIRKEAVRQVGIMNLDQINALDKYHTGGFVGSAGMAASSFAGASLIPSALGFGIFSTVASGVTRALVSMLGQGLASSIIGAQSGGIGGVDVPGNLTPPQGYQGPWNPNLASGKFPPYEQPTPTYQMMRSIASRGGTPNAKAFIGAARKAFPRWLGGLVYDDYSRRGYNGAAGPPWSQHSWGNAIDFNGPSTMANDVIAYWAYQNRNALNLADIIWRQENHAPGDNPHIHVEFHPAAYDMWTPPVLHKGGVFGKNGVQRLGDMRFESPAMLQYGETVLSKNVTSALNKIGASDASGGTVAITVNIDQMYGDENSYRKLYETLERVGNKISRDRGVPSSTVIRM